jgi:hypothetical protein
MNINKLDTETIKPVYHKPEPDVMAEPVQGYTGTSTDRKTYTEAESTYISQNIRNDNKGSKAKSSKLA